MILIGVMDQFRGAVFYGHEALEIAVPGQACSCKEAARGEGKGVEPG